MPLPGLQKSDVNEQRGSSTFPRSGSAPQHRELAERIYLVLMYPDTLGNPLLKPRPPWTWTSSLLPGVKTKFFCMLSVQSPFE